MSSYPSRHPSLARRALPALTLAGAGGLLLIELDHPSPPTARPAPGSLSAAPATSPAAPQPAHQAPAVGAAGPSDAAGTVPSTVPATPQACTKDATGPTEETRWGPVQVEALVSSDGKVCDIQALQSPSGERRSLSINAWALPILHDRAVQSGSGFDAVSGATITSEGYRSSLQAILDGG